MPGAELQKKLLNGVLFQVGWFAAVLGGNAWAVTALLVMLIVHSLWWVRSPKEWWLILVVSLLGCCLDSFWFAQGVLIPGAEPLALGDLASGDLVTNEEPLAKVQSGWFMPAWLACIWLMFSMTLCHVFSWLHGRYVLAAVLGAVAGPVSYLGGAELSGLSLGEPQWQSLLALAVAWALLMPLFVGLAQRVYTKN
ncbi:DUF2878 domain-containing protein [Pseudomaricurvus sp.]|uniref:DUF2878 domain-containing protein n=1 Tax=Pseudomaricurvus sp. TaxID=2004510 RepID=UPI003F6AE6F9